MRVYAESNFVPELALEQASHVACASILSIAEAGGIELALPAYALLEPLETLTRRSREWRDLALQVDAVLGQVRRTASLAKDVEGLSTLTVRASKLAFDHVEDLRRRLLNVARIVPVDQAALLEAEKVRVEFGLEHPDAVMLGAILVDLRSHGDPSLFIDSNTKDFGDQRLKEQLAASGCTFIGHFPHALARIEASAASPG